MRFFLTFSLSFILCISLNAQNAEWTLQAKGIGPVPLVPTVQNYLTRDSEGNLYLTSQVVDSTQLGSFIIHGTEVIPGVYLNASYIAKISAEGEPLWVKTFTGTGQFNTRDIITDADDNVLVVGLISGQVEVDGTVYESEFSAGDMTLAKFDGDGNLIWLVMAESQPGFSSSYGASLAVSPSGNIIVCGGIQNNVLFQGTLIETGDNLFMASYTGEGSLNWVRAYGTNSTVIRRSEVDVDSENNIYWTGRTNSAAGTKTSTFDTITIQAFNGAAFLGKFNSNGAVEWLNSWPLSQGGFGKVVSTNVFVDRNDNSVTICGDFADTIQIGNTTLTETFVLGSNMFIAKFNTSGESLWARQSTGLATAPLIFDIAGNNNGDIFIGLRVATSTGFQRDFTLGEGANAQTFEINGLPNGILAKYNSNGEFQWLKGLSSFAGENDVRSVVATGENSVALTGLFSADVKFGSMTLNSAPGKGSTNVYVVECNGNLSSSKLFIAPDVEIEIFPNPATQHISVRLDDPKLFDSISLHTLDGKLIEQHRSNRFTTFFAGKLPRGIYVVTFSGENVLASRKIVVQ